ncbi:IclR family transcriptional regulator [Caenimonas soli]|uniref:IclR family transcriptional regulator n=1 Tax=Caenimonas soli TaxID=2735555 RepID=UPI0015534288|nr:IclR family transcriptional regulator [Caenimonas soli]NPC59121.1 IclR family transcriptional regulator [Caenimonas soli]
MKPLATLPLAISESSETPALRLISLLEIIASTDRLFSLQGLAQESGLPKATLHRMLQQLESSGLVQKWGDGRHFGTGIRLRRLAENLLLNDSRRGARHAVLRELVREVGESCNLTALSGSEVMYLDRVETAAPLRFYLHTGSRVPVHCSASGKVFLAQMPPAQRKALLKHLPLETYTPKTLTGLEQIEEEVRNVELQGYAVDNEEFLPGLMCLAVPVPADHGRANLCVALQAPIMRMLPDRISIFLDPLQRAATALSKIEADADFDESIDRRKQKVGGGR